jgi:hypothetical protein
MNQPKVILYIAASVDGYIAKPGDDLSFLSMVEKEGEDYGTRLLCVMLTLLSWAEKPMTGW